MIHVTREGVEMDITDMSDEHLLNTIRHNERKAKQGVEVLYGVGGYDGYDCDTKVVYGEEALEYLNHDRYVIESKRRGLQV